MTNRYRHVELPSWVHKASRETLIKHIQFLTHTRDVERKALGRARYRYRKAEKKLKYILGESYVQHDTD
jgi:hypothetical protein